MVDKIENILVEFDYNNIIVVDPNKVVDLDGNVKERFVKQEDLVMYANLECKVLPRTKLAVGSATDDAIQTVSIASINFLNPGNKTFMDNAYTDEITGKDTIQGKGVNQVTQKQIQNPKKSDDWYLRQTLSSGGKDGATDNGLLGITNISINQNLSFMPTIDIQLEDVKGRALFEGGDNSPYAAFFNLPYPLFNLTIKGFYGKAIKLALMLQTFTTRYDSNDGNFKVSLKFYTYKYTILSEISMGHLIATPHMYKSRLKVQTQQGGPSQFSKIDNQIVEKGYQKIKEMYNEYKSKGLIPNDFPELTIVQLRNNIENFVKNILDSFTKQNLDPITNIDDYQGKLNDFEKKVFLFVSEGKGSWFDQNMDKVNFLVLNNGDKIYTFKKELDNNNGQGKINAKSDLNKLITEYKTILNNNETLGVNGSGYTINNKTKKISIPFNINKETFGVTLTPNDIKWDETYRQVKKVKTEPTDDELTKFKDSYKFITTEWYRFEGVSSFMDLTGVMGKQLKVFREEIETELTIALSDLLQSKDNGIGFVPNIRNVLAVIFANGEAFLRLMDEVHYKAWQVREDKYRKEAIFDKEVSSASPDNLDSGTDETIPIYPWPQYIVSTPGENGQEKFEIQYPGDSKFVSKTKGYLYDVWPEVEFVEEFIRGYVERTTPPADPTAGNDATTETQRVSFNAIEFPTTDEIFSNKEEIKFIYEIYERLLVYDYYTRLSLVYNTNEVDSMVQSIAEAESENILKSLSNTNTFLIKTLKDYSINSANFLLILRHISNGGAGLNWQNFIRGIFNTVYIKNFVDNNSFDILNIQDFISSPIPLTSLNSENNLIKYLTGSTTSNKVDFTDLYPFSNYNWIFNNLANGTTISSIESAFNTTKILNYDVSNKIISNFTQTDTKDQKRPITNFVWKENVLPYNPDINLTLKSFYQSRTYKKQFLTEGNLNYLNYSGNVTPNQSVSILNTPYFVNAVQEGVDKFRNFDEYPYKVPAYLFLNSLPLGTLREKYKTYESNSQTDLDYIFATLKKFGAIHRLPYAWILKLGSVWHRYKTYVETNVDILTPSWSGFNYVNNFDPVTNNPTKDYALTINGGNFDIILEKNTTIGVDTSSLINVGFYPKMVNDFNVFYQGFELLSGYTSVDVQNAITSGLTLTYVSEALIAKSQNTIGSTTASTRDITIIPWSVYVKTFDNNSFYLMPSEGSLINQTIEECFTSESQKIEVTGNTSIYNGSVRSFWAAPNYGYFDVNKIVKPTPLQYLKQVFSGQSDQENFSLNSSSTGYTDISEMFTVFEKNILDKFEQEFLNYSKSVYDTLNGDYLNNFQSMMREIAKVPTQTGSTNYDLVLNIQEKQKTNINSLIKNFLEFDKYIKYGNPSGYDKKLFYTFSQLDVVDPYGWSNYTTLTPNALPYNGGGITLSQSKTNNPDAWKALETYIGFSTLNKLTYSSNGSYITDFFIDCNVAFTEDNVVTFAPIIKLYAAQKSKDNTLTYGKFITDMTLYLNNIDSFQDKVINNLMTILNKQLPNVNNSPEALVSSDLQGPQSKVELWESFKAINDKWISGNDFKVKTLFEDILLLDRASRNIGDKILVDVYKLKNRLQNVLDSPKVSMLVFVQTILQENNFVVHNLPSYVNFYNVQDVSKNPKPKPEGTLEFANTLFGTFLNVDYRNSGPKMVCYYAGKPSEQLDLKNNVDYRYRNDAFDLRRSSDNPLNENLVDKNDWDKSNKVVGFNVDIGPQNQSIFYGFMVDQQNSQSTAEALEAINQMANQAGNRGGSTQSVSLYNLYKNRSYTCTISMMGNALIQPTMYFNLRHVPMFSGPYMIQTVGHTISPGSFETIITGIRQPTASLPKIENYIQTLKNNLLQNIIENNKKDKEAKEKQNKDASGTTQSQQAKIQAITGGDKSLTQPQTCTPSSPYNTYFNVTPTVYDETFSSVKSELSNVIAVSNVDGSKLKYVIFAALYVESANGNLKFTAYENNFAGVTLTSKWGSVETYFNNNKQFFCQTSEGDKTTLPYAVFDDLFNHLKFLVGRWKDRMTSDVEVSAQSIAKFLILNNVTINGPNTKDISVYNSYDSTRLKNLETKVQKAIDIYNATN